GGNLHRAAQRSPLLSRALPGLLRNGDDPAPRGDARGEAGEGEPSSHCRQGQELTSFPATSRDSLRTRAHAPSFIPESVSKRLWRRHPACDERASCPRKYTGETPAP